MPLQGKIALVTGAARGIGRAYSRRLAADGARVIAVDIDDPTESLAGFSNPENHLALVCDVSDAAEINDVKATVLDRFGRLDILVNNAAIFPSTTLDSLTIELWRRVQATNVESVLHFTKAFAPGMRDAGWGRIVNSGSTITLGQASDLLAYMTSKGSVHALTRALANELGPSGITVNAIAPGVVSTEGFNAISRKATPAEIQQRAIATQTIKRPSTPEDLANTLAFLASDDADFITGQIIHVDGGLTRSGA